MAVIVPLLILAGCSSTRWNRDVEMQADQPRALGLGAFAPSCLFICIVEAQFTQTEQNGTDKDAPVRITDHGSVYTGPKRDAPKEPVK